MTSAGMGVGALDAGVRRGVVRSYAAADSFLDALGVFVSRPLSAVVSVVTRRVLNLSWSAASVGYRVALLGLITAVLLHFAAFVYFILYYFLVPVHAHRRPVYFDFTPAEGGPPRAIVSLVHEQWWYTDSSANLIPAASRLLASGEAYDVFIDLHVPDLADNGNAGMVMLKASMNSGTPQLANVLARSARPVLPPYSSAPVRLGREMVLLLPLMLGFVVEQQTITVPLYEGYVENTRFATTFMNLTLETTGASLCIDSASVRFVVQLHGLRWIIYNWFLTSAVASISAITISLLVVIILLYWIRWIAIEQKKGSSSAPKYAAMLRRPGDQPSSSLESEEICNDSDGQLDSETGISSDGHVKHE